MNGMRYQPQGSARLSQSARGVRLALNGATPGRPAFGPSAVQTGEASRASAIFGMAQSFNGSNQALTVPLDLRNTEAVTVIALVDGLGSSGAQQILWEFGADTVGTRQGFDAYVNSSGFLEVWTGSSGTQREGNTYVLPAGQHVIACTYDHTQPGQSQVALYVDGVLQTRTAVVATGVPRGAFLSSNLYIAARTASSSWANVRIGALFVFDRALPSNEIFSISQNPWQPFADPDEDDYLAPQAASYTLNVQPAAMALTTSPVGMRASRKLAVAPAALSLAASNVAMLASRRLAVLPAAMAVTGGQVVARVSRRLPVTPAAMVMTGGPVSMPYAPKPEAGSYSLPVSAAAMTITGGSVGMRVARRLRVEPASLVLAGRAVRMLVRRRLMVSPAGLQLAGGSVTLRFSARGEPFDISKIHPSRLVIFEGSGSRITPFEGSGSRITPFEGSGSRITRFE